MFHLADGSSVPINKPTVMLVGTSHWGNPNRDLINTHHDDMLSSKRQPQIAACVDRLARFRPTKVALEVLPEDAAALNEDYRQYRAGSFALTANERHQLGFRLAAARDHGQVYAIDWQGIIGWERALDFAQAHGQAARLEAQIAAGQREAEQASERLAALSVLDLLREANDPARQQQVHAWYMLLALVGEGANHVGAEVIGNWYQRNLRIFVNLARITSAPDDRILVIIGSGHIPLLTHFVEGSGLYTIEPVAPYLN